jgi:hypothetical protein
MRINPTSLSIVIKTRICVQQRSDQQEQIRRKNIKDREYLHFIALPRLSISPRRNRSASVAREAFERATSTFAVIVLNSCWVHLNWSRKDRIKDNSPAEGAHLSTATKGDLPAEEPSAIS